MIDSLFLNDDFSQNFWRTKVYYCANALSEKFLSAFDIPFLEKRLSSSSYLWRNEAMLRSEHQEIPIYVKSFEDLKKGLREGKTFQIYNFDKELPDENEIYKFAQQLERYLLHPLEAISLFISPPNSQAIKLHQDSYEIFTLQIAGSKLWHFPNRQSEEKTITLNKADLLYVPAKLEHAVSALNSFSISLALIFRPLQFKQLLKFILSKELRKKLNMFTLPIVYTKEDENKLETEVSFFLEEIKTEINSLSVDTLVNQLFVEALSTVAPEPIHFYEDFEPDANFKINENMKYEITINANSTILYLYGGKRISFHSKYTNILEIILNTNGLFSLKKIENIINPNGEDPENSNIIEFLLHKLWAYNVIIQNYSAILD